MKSATDQHHAIKPSTFCLRTFGCKTNQYESEGIREALLNTGLTEVDATAFADIAVINTCAVTGRADASSRAAVRAILRENPGATIIITGCTVDLKEEWLEQFRERVILAPNPRKHLIPVMLGLRQKRPTAGCADQPNTETSKRDSRFGFTLRDFASRARAYVKIQDGCDNFCSYCTVPFARGAPTSRPLDEIIMEARALIAAGHRELVLTGINIAAYHRPDNTRLDRVVRMVGDLPGLLRLRLGSVEPNLLTRDLLLAIRDTKTACPHLHLPLQSGSDPILAAMNRPYNCSDFMRVVQCARSTLADPAITTDVIVGFPGEGEREFADTLELCNKVGFSRTHVFLYSPRSGTKAADMKQTCPNRVITERHELLRREMAKSASDFAVEFIGKTVRTIPEAHKDGLLWGYTDRYLRICFKGDENLIRACVELRVRNTDGEILLGEI